MTKTDNQIRRRSNWGRKPSTSVSGGCLERDPKTIQGGKGSSKREKTGNTV